MNGTLNITTQPEIGDDIYRSLVNNSNTTVLLGVPDGIILFANKAAREMFGYTFEEFTKINRTALFDTADGRYIAGLQLRETNNIFRGEVTAIKKNGERFQCNVSSVIFTDTDGHEKTSTTIIDLTERVQAEAGAKRSQQFLNLILANTEESFLMIDRNLNIIMHNHAADWWAKRMMGIDIKNGMSIWELAKPERHVLLTNIYENVFNGASHETETKIDLPEGGYCYLINHFKPAFNQIGEVVAAIVTSRDITAKKEAEIKLLQSEEKYRMLFKNNPFAAWIYDFETLKFIEVNDAAIQFYGYSKEEFSKFTLKDIRPADDIPLLLENLEEINGNKEQTDTIWRHRKKNGEIVYVNIKSDWLVYNDKTARLVMINDVTMKVEAETELIKSTERFLLASKATSDAIWDRNLISNELKWGEGLFTLFGHHGKDVTYEKWASLIHPDDRSETEKSILKVMKNAEVSIWRHEYRFKNVSAVYHYILDHAYIVRDESKKAVRMIGAMKDITQLKEKEKELISQNEKFYFASKATSDIIWDWDLTTNKIEWSDNYTKILGHPLPPDSILSFDSCINKFHPDDFERVSESLKTAIGDPALQNWECESKYLKANGQYADIIDHGYIVRNSTGKGVRMIGAMQDITEQKYLQKLLAIEVEIYELSTSEKYDFKNIVKKLIKGIEQLHEGIFCSVVLLTDNETMQTLAAPRFPKEYVDAINDSPISLQSHPSGVAMFTQSPVIVEDLQTDSKWKHCHEIAEKFGIRACWSIPIINSTGNVMASFAIHYAIPKTPEKNELNTLNKVINLLRILMENNMSLEQMRISNERYDIVSRATNDLIWDWDLEADELYRDPEGLKKVYGLMSNESIKRFNDWLERIHPDDREKVRLVIHEMLQTNQEKTFEVEYRFKRQDNTYSHVYDRGYIMRNTQGKPYRMIGAAQDVTERKRLEQELLGQELNRQRAISQATIDTQEKERAEIGKEMHDNINQVLTTTKLYLDLAVTNEELKEEMIAKSSKNIIYVINEIRQLSRSLMMPSLGDLGLIDSLNDLIESINATGKLKVTLLVNNFDENILEQNLKLMIFRLAQEAFNNILKHASATIAIIHLMIEKKYINLTITDDGKGFDISQIKRGAGLNNIQNRVYLFNGSLLINTAPGKGCELVIDIPFSHSFES
ncbi:MAG: PAS domain S-box protein [Bacteroidota bacterium]|nr:PAS domain S-box protein [Bacteroidota bacterium]